MRCLPALATLVLVACGSAPAPAVAPSPDPAAPAASSATLAAAPTEEPAPRRPLDLTSACPHDVHLYFGDQPGDGKGQAAVATTGATIAVPRAPDGTMVVWVVDEKGAGLASVHITKHMRHVRIDAACMKLDADSTR